MATGVDPALTESDRCVSSPELETVKMVTLGLEVPTAYKTFAVLPPQPHTAASTSAVMLEVNQP
jgi:hypothetical protein